MKIQLNTLFCLLLLVVYSTASYADDKAIIHDLLNNFLANSVKDDYKNHNNFWAHDLIYTSSNGTRFDKNTILKGIEQESNNQNSKPPLFWAEDVDIRLYGHTAIVAFKLMHKAHADSSHIKQRYFNTGTLIKRNNQWQVVAWQATKIP